MYKYNNIKLKCNIRVVSTYCPQLWNKTSVGDFISSKSLPVTSAETLITIYLHLKASK